MDYPTIPALNVDHEFGKDISPFLADLVVLPIDSTGSEGKLNTTILDKLGYSYAVLPSEDKLTNGYHYFTGYEGCANILFVVTVGDGETKDLLKDNLKVALEEVKTRDADQTIWIPLMGTGAGNLSHEESLYITAEEINYAREIYGLAAYFYISLPASVDESWLKQHVRESKRGGNRHRITSAELFVDNLKVNTYILSLGAKSNRDVVKLVNGETWRQNDKTHPLTQLMGGVDAKDIIIYNMSQKFYNSNFQKSKSGEMLEITAIGIVVNLPDKKRMKIDWRMSRLNINVQSLRSYTERLERAWYRDIVAVLENLSSADWGQIANITLSPFVTPVKISTGRISHFHSDIDTTTDHLNISQDVAAFARIIAARSFQPPLAIAVLGKWGSGKSFFMEQLRRKIQELSWGSMEDAYCAGIAQIHFNAWSYMDTNLWASIISRIFEQLNVYIQADDSKEEAKKEIRQILTKSLNITKEEITFLENRKEQIDNQIEALENKEVELRNELNEKIKAIRTKTLKSVVANVDQQFHVKKQIIKSLNENRSFGKSKKELRQIVPEEYWNNPEEAYKQAKSTYSFLCTFFRKGKILSNSLWFLFIVFLIVAVPFGLFWLEQQIVITGFLIPPFIITFLSSAGIVFTRMMSTYKELKPVIASFWKIKEAYETAVEDAVDKMKQEEKALALEIEKGRADLIIVNEQIVSAKAIQADLDFRISNALATETLYNFIDKRSKSEDYRKHLGIISIIRKDLETLNGLFYDHQGEVNENGETETFRSHFKVKLQRIVLYIDDLDRCPEELVVQVLEAVNLLMAFPLFVVVVGVDSRWIKNALIKKHALQFGGLKEQMGENLECLEPADYLEKIFQVPFRLKEPDDEEVKAMINKLANTGPLLAAKRLDGESIDPNHVKDIKIPVKNLIEAHISEFTEVPGEQVHTASDNAKLYVPKKETKSNDHQVEVREQIEMLVLTQDEIDVMQQMAGLLGANPRTVKRFVNIFRIIKAHEGFHYENEEKMKDLTAILFILSFSLGPFRKLVPDFVKHLFESRFEDGHLTLFFRKESGDDRHGELGRRLMLKFNGDTYYTLNSVLRGNFIKHYHFIKRFTFKDI